MAHFHSYRSCGETDASWLAVLLLHLHRPGGEGSRFGRRTLQQKERSKHFSYGYDLRSWTLRNVAVSDLQIRFKLLYQFGELVTAGIADPLSWGGAVEPEGPTEARLGPCSTNGVLDGVENRCGQKQRRLAHSLEVVQKIKSSAFYFFCTALRVVSGVTFEAKTAFSFGASRSSEIVRWVGMSPKAGIL